MCVGTQLMMGSAKPLTDAAESREARGNKYFYAAMMMQWEPFCGGRGVFK